MIKPGFLVISAVMLATAYGKLATDFSCFLQLSLFYFILKIRYLNLLKSNFGQIVFRKCIKNYGAFI